MAQRLLERVEQFCEAPRQVPGSAIMEALIEAAGPPREGGGPADSNSVSQ